MEIFLCRTLGCNKFEGLSEGLFRRQATDKNLCDLASSDDAIAGVASLPRIALQEDQLMLIGFVVVEPTGAHDSVRTSACADQPFSTPLPVVRLGGTVIGARPVRDSDCGH